MEDDWERDKFEDGSTIQVGEQQLEKMKDFVDRHALELHKIEEALDESMTVGWDLNFDPIALDLTPYEQTNILDLVKTKSKPLSKVTTVFASLCLEVDFLTEQAENTFFPPLALFGELHTLDPLEGDAQIQIGKMFPFFVDLLHFIERIYEVLKNLVRQLCSLYHPKQKGFETIQLATCWRYLGQIFQLLITFDEVIKTNEAIGRSWGRYKRMMTQIRKDAEPYAVKEEQIFHFEKLMLRLKGVLMDNLIFQNGINQPFEEPSSGRFQIRNNPVFKERFFEIIRNLTNDLRSEASRGDPNLGKKYMRACTLFAFYCTLYPEKPEIKTMAALWEVYKICPLVHLYATSTWDALVYFKASIPRVVTAAKVSSDISKAKKEYLGSVVKAFPVKVAEYHMRISQWLIQMESDPKNLKHQSSLVTKGIFYGQGLSELLKKYLFLHFSLDAQLPTSQFTLIFKCYELLKGIRTMYHRRSALIGESLSKMMKNMAFQIQQSLMPIFHSLSDTRKAPSYAQLDALAAVTLAIQMMNGPATCARSIIFQLAYRQIPPTLFKKGQEEYISSRLSHWDVLANLDKSIQQTCDCSLLYWTKELLPSYFKFIYNNPATAPKLIFLFGALNDIIPLMKKSVHVPNTELLGELQKVIEGQMKKELILPLSMELHEDLALHIHHGTINKEVARKFQSGPFLVRDLSPFLRVRALQFWTHYISIKEIVQHFLNRTFYDLNTVALYNWQAFGEMRSLAFSKYGLDLPQVHLPGHTLEQGLDILQIMRMIERFVVDYRYNLNNQIFIERTSENNYLSVINVQHIANSIRTHGTGIMSTAVSVTYQFLKEKIHLFSQFLFDELIKSRLYRDGIALSDMRKETNNVASWRYPYDTAKKFEQYVRQIGLTKDKKTFLQKFLELVSEIGNALGYVRMIRSGGMLYTSNAIQFVPDLSDIQRFSDMAQADNLSGDTVAAAENLDSVVNNLSQNFSEGADYFKMLINVFATQYRSPENAHLKNFYLIVPALTLSFVESIGTSKERYNKKGKEEGGFTDDGFAIGVAYLLKLLDQNREFDSLNWFKSAVKYYKDELQAKGNTTARDANVKIQQLTKNKLAGELNEFQLLRFSFSSARIFFHD